MDGGKLGVILSPTEAVDIKGTLFYVLHDPGHLDLDPKPAGFSGVIYGHSHKPARHEKNGVLYLNPGSAGPKRFQLPVTLVLMTMDGFDQELKIKTEFIDLED
jgi:predicted phosphodiesterase